MTEANNTEKKKRGKKFITQTNNCPFGCGDPSCKLTLNEVLRMDKKEKL